MLAEASAPLAVSRPRRRLVGAVPGRLDRRRRGGVRRAGGRAAAGAMCGHRAVGADARRDPARRAGRGAAALHPVERHPRPRGGGRARRRSDVPRDHRQHRLPRLHRAQAGLGRSATSRSSSSKVAKVLLPKDYLRLWLTGEHVAEMSDAAGTSWLDTGARDWSDDLLARDRPHAATQMPRLVEGSEVSGTLRPSSGRALGHVQVAWSWPAAAATTPRRASASAWCGPARPSCRSAPRACCSPPTTAISPAPRDRGAHLLPRPARHLAPDGRDPRRDRRAELVSPRSSGRTPPQLTGRLGPLQAPGKTLFLPYLGGERTPHNDAGDPRPPSSASNTRPTARRRPARCWKA